MILKDMKRIKHLLPSVCCVALLCLTACHTENEPQGDSLPLCFLTTVDEPQTRADLTTDNLLTMGVFAYHTSDNFSDAATPGFMFNQKVERTDNTSPWTYSPLRYWPNNPSDKLTFFAYAPYVDETTAGGSNPAFPDRTTAKGYLTFTYTVPEKEADGTDLLVAVPLMNYTYANAISGKIAFKMTHALTRVNIKIVGGESHTVKTVTALSLFAPASAKLTVRIPPSTGETPCVWSDRTANKEIKAGISSPVNVTSTASTLATFYLIPPAGNPSSVSLKLNYTFAHSDGTTGLTAMEKTVSLSATPAWTPGASVSYILNISGSQLTIESAEEDISWGSGGDPMEGELK